MGGFKLPVGAHSRERMDSLFQRVGALEQEVAALKQGRPSAAVPEEAEEEAPGADGWTVKALRARLAELGATIPRSVTSKADLLELLEQAEQK